MAAASGQYGQIKVGGSTLIECTEWTMNEEAAEGHTLVGGMAIAAGTSGSFRTRCSAANTAITYRL